MSKSLLTEVFNGLNNTVAMLSPKHIDSVTLAIQGMASSELNDSGEEKQIRNKELAASYGIHGYTEQDKPFVFHNGIAYIPITGMLINRYSYSWGYVTGYNFVRAQLTAALDDNEVELIVFDVNSGGGMVAGCFELAEDIYQSRSIKPSIAMVDAYSYSAAYALASSATNVYITPSGGAGSIGCLMMHMDISRFYEDFGVKMTLIYSGSHKVDGNSFESLPDTVRQQYQEQVDMCRDQFARLVARNRGIEYQAVMDTEAQTYGAEEALQLGLVDAVTTPLKAVSVFNEQSRSNDVDDMKGSKMTTTTTVGAAEQNQAQQMSAADARKAERQRISEITGCDEAKGKSKLANHLALNTEMSVEDAKAVLAAAADEVQPVATTQNALEQAMNATGGGAGITVESSAEGGASEMSAAEQILMNQKLVTGVDAKKEFEARQNRNDLH